MYRPLPSLSLCAVSTSSDRLPRLSQVPGTQHNGPLRHVQTPTQHHPPIRNQTSHLPSCGQRTALRLVDRTDIEWGHDNGRHQSTKQYRLVPLPPSATRPPTPPSEDGLELCYLRQSGRSPLNTDPTPTVAQTMWGRGSGIDRPTPRVQMR
uniref:Uncharacterized protein n=1 Tax=Eutreptiella gymnastica TaxID=73025 RepID=A0A7S4CTU8_9EUGL